MDWKISIVKSWQDKESNDWKVWCRAYHVPTPAYPPYPGHIVIEEMLEQQNISKKYERVYNGGDSVLEITFKNSKEALVFLLRWS